MHCGSDDFSSLLPIVWLYYDLETIYGDLGISIDSRVHRHYYLWYKATP